MAVRGAPTGSKLGGQVKTGRRGRSSSPTGQQGANRTALPKKGGNPKGPHASLVSGAQANGKKGGD